MAVFTFKLWRVSKLNFVLSKGLSYKNLFWFWDKFLYRVHVKLHFKVFSLIRST